MSRRRLFAAPLAAGAITTAVLAVGLPQLRPAPPLSSLAAPAADSALSGARLPVAPLWRQQVDTLRRGETLSELFARAGLSSLSAALALRAAPDLDARRVPAGTAVTVRSRGADSVPSELVLRLAIDRLVRLRRTGDSWTGREVRLPWKTDTVVVSGVIESTLYEALDSSAASVLPPPARAELAWALADIYEYRIDMSRDLQQGDEFRVLVERSVGPGGATRIGSILAARVASGGDDVEAIRFADGGDRAQYYDQRGRSLRAAFLRAPLAFRRISSVFGRRKHPILGVWKQHTGIDYAAGMGTPVRAIGDGVVIYAAPKGSYGNAVEIRYRNGYVSRYAHLRGFARGIRRGTRVGIGQTVAYVGMTGRTTGPHLHFEILVNGVRRDPRLALGRTVGVPLSSAERERFDAARASMVAQLDAAPSEPLAMR